MTVYEEAVSKLQARDYGPAARLFKRVLEDFPEERELQERSRLYLNVCERHVSKAAVPQTAAERIYAATLALNREAYAEAIGLLESAVRELPNHDNAAYMLAVAHAQLGHVDAALKHLGRAIELNPDNRALARRDLDLLPVRLDPRFRSVTEAPPSAPPEPERRPVRRSSR